MRTHTKKCIRFKRMCEKKYVVRTDLSVLQKIDSYMRNQCVLGKIEVFINSFDIYMLSLRKISR